MPKLIEAEYQEMHFNPKYRSPVLIRESPDLELKGVFSNWELEAYSLKAKWLISTKITSEIDKLSVINQNFSDYILNIKVCWFCSLNLSNLLFFNHEVTVLTQTTIIFHMAKSPLNVLPTSASAFFKFVLQMFTLEGCFAGQMGATKASC